MSAADWAGIVTCIGAVTAGVGTIVTAVRAPKVARQVEEVHTAVSTSNGHTIGELVEKNEARHADPAT